MTQARKITRAMLVGVADRLWPKASINEESGCLEWLGSRTSRGYGRILIGREWWPAHRIAYAIAKSIPAQNELVRHKCDNPRCINPAHLEPGDDYLNAQDRKERGRDPDRRGENNGRARLSVDDVKEIRRSALGGRALARKLGMPESTIRYARSGRNWGHIQ